jgi:hypothetical protein
MRLRTSVAAAVSVAAAGFMVAGCNSSGSSSAAATSAAASTVPTAPASGTSSQGQAAGGGGICQTANLTYSLGPSSSATSQRTQTVTMTNSGSSACTLQGFPGVDLVGAANGQQNYSWPLVRSSATYSAVTLQPGGTAHFDLMYLPGGSGTSGNISVVKMVITPPNDYTQAELTWDQSVVLQDGATHPGTFITPVTSGS